jgi:threonine/homoserine/homoserine lactone efflux protein
MIVQVLLVAFIISYLGSIPPGAINVSVMQMAMQGKRRAAIFFSLAASMVEFVYAGLTVKFQIFLNTKTILSEYFLFITAGALIVVGVLNLFSKQSSKDVHPETMVKGRQGFKRGILLGALNPMTIPFWLMITAYLQNHGWVELSGMGFWSYLIGLTAGTFFMLMTVLRLGRKFTQISDNVFLVHRLPGLVLIGLGIYNLVKWWW